MASLLVVLGAAYFGLGLLFAVPFAWGGAGTLDDAAKTAPVGFRFLLLPGAAALWPLLAIKWSRALRGARA